MSFSSQQRVRRGSGTLVIGCFAGKHLVLKKDALKDLSARRAASAVKGSGRSGSTI